MPNIHHKQSYMSSDHCISLRIEIMKDLFQC